ncbi:MAG: hypothetical protein BMS9Abin22_474 [Gammaproteobacteria bacterium]|nr:MAG: hypothetical protein BMS9Abin22_474 [Gammaproteobacteria bacterium]
MKSLNAISLPEGLNFSLLTVQINESPMACFIAELTPWYTVITIVTAAKAGPHGDDRL